jgi:glycine/D-amino acid oxidase-like deaminating enzyme
MVQAINDYATWYEATAQRGTAFVALTGSIDSDVCVIGGGLAGLTTCLELARRGLKVVLLEGRLIASGASGRNGGFVSNGFALGMEGVVQHVGKDAAQELYSLSRLGTEYVRAEIAATDPTIKMGDGWMVSVRHDDAGGLGRYGEALQRDYDEDMQLLSVEATRQRLSSPRYFESLYFPKAFHIHPLRYCLMLANKTRATGAQIFENSAVLSVEKTSQDFLVKTAMGQVRARHVVHCVSSTGRNVHGPSGRAVLPVATYIAVTEALDQKSINTPAAISDTRRAGDYYRLIDEGRILWGGRITTQVSAPARLAEKMKGDMLSTYPDLGNPRIDYAWAGLMGYALHKMPLIGRDGEGQWFATAFGGHGLNTTAMAGMVLARAIADGDDSYRQFAPFAPRWAYGQLGRLGVQGSYWWMQIRDKYDESRLFSAR